MAETDTDTPVRLARLVWKDPQTGEPRSYDLTEGATVTLGRMADNDICIRERHVSRRHAVISYRAGIFTINDLGSANGTFVNDRQLTGLFPLASGDRIRLFVPTLIFCALPGSDDNHLATTTAFGSDAALPEPDSQPRLIITGGAQEGQTFPLNQRCLIVGRATADMQPDLCLLDPAVSRSHARIELGPDHHWRLYDLGSVNGTLVNGTVVDVQGCALRDGDTITFGGSTALFRER
ncbi:MAG: FHA domain-containing protein [Chloroflexota bacterium]|nr:MAG: hypothetical protein DIU68_03930 [Chloroflexota bacterium]